MNKQLFEHLVRKMVQYYIVNHYNGYEDFERDGLYYIDMVLREGKEISLHDYMSIIYKCEDILDDMNDI